MSNEELVQQIQQGINTKNNIEQLYIQNKGLIYSTIKRYRYACQSDYNSLPIIEMDELMNEAYFGLVKAVESYDANQGILFMSYAPNWIRQTVKRYLDNCGKTIRVPVHTQQKIYQYNQVTAHYLQNFNRYPDVEEYARMMYTSVVEIVQLQKFMFQDQVKSLDDTILGTEEEVNLTDTLECDIDIENDVVERMFQEQVRCEVWSAVEQVLKDDRKVQILRLRYEKELPLREIGRCFHVTGPAVDCLIRNSLRLIKRNASVRRLAIETGLWKGGKPFSIDRVRIWCRSGRYQHLDKKELAYAIRMGWLDKELYG